MESEILTCYSRDMLLDQHIMIYEIVFGSMSTEKYNVQIYILDLLKN